MVVRPELSALSVNSAPKLNQSAVLAKTLKFGSNTAPPYADTSADSAFVDSELTSPGSELRASWVSIKLLKIIAISHFCWL